MNYKEELLLQELAMKIVYSWDSIQDYKDWVYEKEIAKWKVEVYDYIIDPTTSNEELDYVLTYLYNNAPAKCYLEVNELVSNFRIEKHEKKFSIISYIKGKLFSRRSINAQKVCSDNSIHVWGNGNDNTETRPNSSS